MIKRGDIVILAGRTSCFVLAVNYITETVWLSSIDRRITNVAFEMSAVKKSA